MTVKPEQLKSFSDFQPGLACVRENLCRPCRDSFVPLELSQDSRPGLMNAAAPRLEAALLHHPALRDPNIIPAGILHQVHHLVSLANNVMRALGVVRISRHS